MESPQLAAATAISCAHTLVRRRSRTSLGGGQRFLRILFWVELKLKVFVLLGEFRLSMTDQLEFTTCDGWCVFFFGFDVWVKQPAANSTPGICRIPAMAKITSLIWWCLMITTGFRRPCSEPIIFNNQSCNNNDSIRCKIYKICLPNHITFISSQKIK